MGIYINQKRTNGGIQVRGGNVGTIKDIVIRLLDDRNIGYEYKLYTK